MKDSTLLEIKNQILKEKQDIIAYNKTVKRIKRLLEIKQVKEYLELTNTEPEKLDFKEIDEDKIIKRISDRFVWNIKENETNGIFVYRGTFEAGYDYDIVHGPSDRRVPRDSPFATHRDYWDLEQHYPFEVPIKKCEEFEKSHIVIFTSGNYYRIRQEFITEALKNGQEKAVKTIIKRYKKM